MLCFARVQILKTTRVLVADPLSATQEIS